MLFPGFGGSPQCDCSYNRIAAQDDRPLASNAPSRQASPFGDKRQVVGIIPSPYRFQKTSDKCVWYHKHDACGYEYSYPVLAGILASVAVGGAVGSAVPVAGTVVGAASGLVVGLLYYVVTETPMVNGKSMKTWAKDSF